MDERALQIIKTLRDAGFEALVAGGAARDLLLGREPHDIDIATSARPEEVAGLFERTVAVGAKFGVMLVLLDDFQYEVATFRSDGAYLDGRHPEEVHFSSARQDAERRDFTINGLFHDPLEGGWLDYVDGRRDLERRLIRAIGDPRRRFAEDHLRLLRAVRFACRFDFEIEPETRAALLELAPGLRRISPERVGEELTRILTGPRAGAALRLLHDRRLLREVLPEIEAMDGVAQPPRFHPEGDVLTHTCLMLDLLGESSGAAGEVSPTLAWAALLHDVGKPPCFSVEDRIRFNGHCEVGADMALAICRRLRFSNEFTDRVIYLVKNHLRINAIPQMRPARRIQFLREEGFPELLELLRLDSLGSGGGTGKRYDLIGALHREELAKGPPLAPLLNGRDLIARGYAPGPRFGEILDAVETEHLEDRLADKAAALAWIETNFPSLAAPESATNEKRGRETH